MRLTLLLALLVPAGLPAPVDARPPTRYYTIDGYQKPRGKLPATLLKLYRAKLAAMEKGAAAQHDAFHAAFYLRKMQNTNISMGKPARPLMSPETLRRAHDFMAPDFKRTKVVGLKKNAVMAVLVLFERGRDQRRYFFVPFYREGEGWKQGMPTVVPVEEARPAPRPDEPEWLARLPAVPPLFTRPAFIGRVNALAYGYEVSVAVNGVPQDIAGGKSEDTVLLGGLRAGKNRISIAFERAGDDRSSSLEISIRALIDRQSPRGDKVFTFESKAPRGAVKKTFSLP